ncbi:prepilin-type N-terminal cleavage/methylation domain-containing protein [Escherichia coli]|nr:prepilin-type N-terminal cleavage/methylation domain-containing protein [Escherichia coli]EFT3169149.1 prepilin-type N-terminal cleavage/methylation domain-containing protein [Escherichia coli]EJG8127161.1 prepilin-type N-terminal cleavage/methylation domain-containing protein [Escherichia coli]EJU9700874.1 prepilin-type N-terminal cleavage/methylation domain-containing protein [Escherichia coli]ELN3013632.1 prepilin-type N-terminal cleavage/methylation domain-containing protein [Escherichia
MDKQRGFTLIELMVVNLAALLEPALLIITGGIIGTLVVAMYLPIFHLGDAMSGMG